MKVFDHDTSFEEDEQEETDSKSDGSGGKHDKKIDDKQVSNEFKKGIMLKCERTISWVICCCLQGRQW